MDTELLQRKDDNEDVFSVHRVKIILHSLVFDNHLVDLLLHIAQRDPDDEISLDRQLIPIELSTHCFGALALKDLFFRPTLEEWAVLSLQRSHELDGVLFLRKSSILLKAFLNGVGKISLKLV